MKINIIGPSGSGKSFLAFKLSEKTGIKPTNLDYVFYRHTRDKSRDAIPENEWDAKLNQIVNGETWIIEGVNPIPYVLENAEMIIYIRPSLLLALFRQWKRYFTDPKQQREHGFINNLKLSQYLIRQYSQEEDMEKSDDPLYSRLTKLDRILASYPSKVRVLRNDYDVQQFLQNL